MTELETLEAAWNEINAHIKSGDMSGNGCDEMAQNGGLVIASNIIFEMMEKRRAKASSEMMEAGVEALLEWDSQYESPHGAVLRIWLAMHGEKPE